MLLQRLDNFPDCWHTSGILRNCKHRENWQWKFDCYDIDRQYRGHGHCQISGRRRSHHRWDNYRLLEPFFLSNLKTTKSNVYQNRLHKLSWGCSKCIEWSLQWSFRIQFSQGLRYLEYYRISDEKWKHWIRFMILYREVRIFSDDLEFISKIAFVMRLTNSIKTFLVWQGLNCRV